MLFDGSLFPFQTWDVSPESIWYLNKYRSLRIQTSGRIGMTGVGAAVSRVQTGLILPTTPPNILNNLSFILFVQYDNDFILP